MLVDAQLQHESVHSFCSLAVSCSSIFPWNKPLSALAEQLFSGVTYVAEVSDHFIVTSSEEREDRAKPFEYVNLTSSIFCFPLCFHVYLRATCMLTAVSAG